MNIAMVSTPFIAVPPRHYGGTELVVHELVEGLVERGHAVTLFATGDSSTKAGLRWLYPAAQWPPDTLTDLAHVSWAMAAVAEEGFDLVHVHSAVALACGRLMPDVPLVYTVHHDREEQLSAFYRQFPEANFVAISRSQLEREGPLPNAVVIPHGLDPTPYEWTSAPQDYLAFIGRYSRVKGPHTAIDVAESAGLPIRVAGEIHDVDREWAEAELVARLSRPHVAHEGPVGMDAKVPLLRDARALLAPIEWDEPFGLVLIEAMLSGCPVVAFPRGSVPELVEQGLTGWVVQDAREMADVVRRGGPIDRFDRAACRERAIARFGRGRMVDDHLRLYARLTGDRSATPAGSVARVA